MRCLALVTVFSRTFLIPAMWLSSKRQKSAQPHPSPELASFRTPKTTTLQSSTQRILAAIENPQSMNHTKSEPGTLGPARQPQ
jgi:hypothetical protein